MPGTPSKCRCERVPVGDVIVREIAHLEIVKALVPPADSGRFYLQLDGVTRDLQPPYDVDDAAGDGGTTGKFMVSAGTNKSPGASYTVGETAVIGTDLTNYTKSIVCVDRDTTNVVASSSGPGPLTVHVDPDDDIVCTISNKITKLTLVKNVVNDNGGKAVATDWTLSAAGQRATRRVTGAVQAARIASRMARSRSLLVKTSSV